MLSTKLEVDKHVENCLRKIDGETERNLRCLAFAKLYFKICEYEQARRYASTYLSAKPNSVEALNLLGKVLEKLGKHEAALDAYKKSLDIDPKQHGCVIKVCELLAKNDLDLDISGVRFYCQMAQSFDAHHPVILDLRERLLVAEAQNPEEIVRLLLSELETRPTDVQLRVRLVRHLLQNNNLQKAYQHVLEIERKNVPAFLNDASWYRVAVLVLTRYQQEHVTGEVNKREDWEFWSLLVSVLDRLALLLLNERQVGGSSSDQDCSAVIFNLDQSFRLAVESASWCRERLLVKEFVGHYKAQICFHLSTLLYKHARCNLIKYKDASNMALPLLFLAYHTQPGDADVVFSDKGEEVQRLISRWQKEAAYRRSQAGNILLAAAHAHKKLIVGKAQQHSSGLWRENLFKKLFSSREQHSKMPTSYFVTCKELSDVNVQLPEAGDLVRLSQMAQAVHPESLHHLIWTCSSCPDLADFKCTLFNGLEYSVKNLNNCGAESLNVLDIEAFVYCATIAARQRIHDAKNKIYYNSDEPSLLPAAVTYQLDTIVQTKWFESAIRAYRRDMTGNMTQLRLTLIKGIETVRCVGNHGLDVKLLVTLADVFARRAKKLEKKFEVESNEARAELYWRAALPVLEKFLKGLAHYVHCKEPLFDYKSKEMDLGQIAQNIEDGKLFLGSLLIKAKNYEKALEIFETTRSPYGSFYRAQIYKNMANDQVIQSPENVQAETRSQYAILLCQARDSLYLTLDRLRDPAVDPKHPLNLQLASEINKVERMLTRIELDGDQQSDTISDNESSSSQPSLVYYSANNDFSLRQNIERTPKTSKRKTPKQRYEARPSPERFDAQLRQMQATTSQILEQNRMIAELVRTFVEEFKSPRETIASTNIQEIQNINCCITEGFRDVRNSIEQLRTSVEETQNLHDVRDVIQQLKREVAELRKRKNTPSAPIAAAQLSEEELYALEEECASGDYGLGAVPSLQGYGAAAATGGFYPGLQSAPRLPSNPLAGGLQFPLPGFPNLYPMYYGNLGLPHPGALQYAQDSQLAADIVAHVNPVIASQTTPQASFSQAPSQLTSTSSPWDRQVQQPATSILPSFVTPAVRNSSNLFGNTTALAVTTQQSSLTSANQAPPINVVITRSDPLPQKASLTNQTCVLSVTIPPEHLKGTVPKDLPHNYQIPLPIGGSMGASPSIASIMTQPPPLAVSTKELLSNVSLPIYSAVDLNKNSEAETKSLGLGLQIEKSLNSQSFNLSNVSDVSLEEQDPCPDFKPIVPLPDQVPTNTGEEDETVLFQQRAKLFRFVEKEWKERGIGTLKILRNEQTGKVRVLMRRDQVHKICANHFLGPEMTIADMPNNPKALIWAAHDFADEQTVVEKLCAKFKNEEDAAAFRRAFEGAALTATTCSSPVVKPKSTLSVESSPNSLGGFVFSGTPVFKPKGEESVPDNLPAIKSSAPFAAFNFGSTRGKTSMGTDANKEVGAERKEPADDYQVLFESTAELMQYNALNNECKKCGTGTLKLVKENIVVYLKMQTEQGNKVYFNRQLVNTLNFDQMSNNRRAVILYAQEDSEKVPATQHLVIKFATENLASSFLESVIIIQESLDENNYLGDTTMAASSKDGNKKVKASETIDKQPTSPDSKSIGWAEKFKPKLGSWECRTCYIVNESKSQECVACGTHKVVVAKSPPENLTSVNFSFGTSSSWGHSFKPKSGTWECGACLIRNEDSQLNCIACQSPKNEPTKVPVSNPTIKFDSNPLSLAKTNFLKPPADLASNASPWGDAFKPKSGTWECKICMVRNEANNTQCISCTSPKEGTQAPPKKEPSPFDLTTSAKFNFGIPATQANPSSFSFGTISEATIPVSSAAYGPFSFLNKPTATSPFKFGTPDTKGEVTKSFSFVAPSSTTESPPSAKEQFVFGSPQKHTFDFIPRSPRRQSGGTAPTADEESDGCVDEENDDIHFKPIVPLPDKIEIKTGEEEEDVLYCHRAKLFRFIDGEWKERGLGDVKILRSLENGKLRVVMRREQVLKICLNHYLTEEVEYLLKDDKTWLFSALDYSEGEYNRWQFCLRFKSGEIAGNFKKAIDNALVGRKQKDEVVQLLPTASCESSESDVEFVSETVVTKEEIEEALKLKLPPKFMAYRQLPDCTCETCKKEDILLASLLKEPQVTIESLIESSKCLFGKPCQPTSLESSKFVFGQNPFSKPSDGGGGIAGTLPSATLKPEASSDGSILKDMLMKPSILSNVVESGPKTENKKEPNEKTTGNAFANFSFSIESNSPAALSPFTPKPSETGTSSFIFPTTTSASLTTGSLFNTPISAAKSIFGGGGAVPTNLFSTLPNTLKSQPEPEKAAEQQQPAPDFVLKCDSSLSFASLAAATANKNIFDEAPDSNDSKPFSFVGAGAPVFASLTPKSTERAAKHDEETAEEAGVVGEAEYDPHYEPIVPLPDTIEVKTGEEDENIVFNERAKVYRYDNENKDWKERGVGQLKILYHPVKNTYRLLLRREQVHKIVLNMLITSNTELQPMKMSDKAWLWCGYNHVEEEAVLEKLAARFKRAETAQEFHDHIERCLRDIQTRRESRNLPATIEDAARAPDNTKDYNDDEEQDDDEIDEEEDEDDVEEEEDDDHTIICAKTCVLSEETPDGEWVQVGSGEIRMCYDPEIYVSQIFVADNDGLLLSSTIIGQDTIMEVLNDTCTWRALDSEQHQPRWRHLKAQFTDAESADDFHVNYLVLVQYARENDLRDELPIEEQH